MDTFERKLEALMRICEKDGGPESQELRRECAEYLQMRRRYFAPERETRKLFLELGAPDHLSGHPYAVAAVAWAVKDPELLNNLSLELYPRIAEHFRTNPIRVERSIRHLVEVTWMRGDDTVRERYFGNTVQADRGKPTNSEFIARLANVVRQRLGEIPQ